MKNVQKILAAVLVSVLLCAVISPALAGTVCDGACEYCPTIVIPGLFQSEVFMYDENGEKMKNADGEFYEAPFFLESTGDIVKKALEEALLPIMGELITQQDKKAKTAKAVADTLGEVVMGNILCDETGKPVKNLKATAYLTSLADMSEYDRAYCLDMVPISSYVEVAGAEHLYFLSYLSTGNLYTVARELYDLIGTVKAQTGHDKVNLLPISQGGSIFNALMQIYKDNGRSLSEDVHRVCFIVPAADGAAVLGDIYHYGLLDDDDALYGYMFPSLLDEDQAWLSYLINLLLRYFPNEGLNTLLDTVVDTLIADYLSYSTALWALIPSADYPDCREKYLSDEKHAAIVTQTDWYYNAQINAKAYIAAEQANGVEFFDIVAYDYPLYKIVDSWSTLNADGIIHTSSESFGAVTAPVGCSLGDAYTPSGAYCTDPAHNHLDETKTLDASAGALCETTFYFKGQDHEKTARNDAIIRLAVRVITDDSFKDVYSDPAFPQFNYARDARSLSGTVAQARALSLDGVSEADIAQLEAALGEAEQALFSTVMKTEDYNAANVRLENIVYKIRTGREKEDETPAWFLRMLTELFKRLSDFMLRCFGGKGFSDILLFR